MFTKTQSRNLIVIVLVSATFIAVAAFGWLALAGAHSRASLAAAPAKIYVPNPRVRFAALAGRKPPAPLAAVETFPAQSAIAVDILLALALAALLFAPLRKQSTPGA